MTINKIVIKKIEENAGHIGFCSFVIDDCLKINNVAIFTRPTGGYRLVFPEKKIGDKKIPIIFPLTSVFYFELEKLVSDNMK